MVSFPSVLGLYQRAISVQSNCRYHNDRSRSFELRNHSYLLYCDDNICIIDLLVSLIERVKIKEREKMDYYKRNLPHWQPRGAEFFVTCRLAGSLPEATVDELKQKRKEFRRESRKKDLPYGERSKFEAVLFKLYDQQLDKASSGPTWLSNGKVARTLMDSLHFYDQKHYDLYAYTIMSNHFHLVFRHLEENFDKDFPVTEIMKLIKSFTGRESNKILQRSGQFWQAESFDRVVRDAEELENVILYTLNNPVKARLTRDWIDWPFSYCKSEFI